MAVHRFPPYIGGCEKYAYNLATGLSDKGIEVTVYTSRCRFEPKLKQNFQIREFHAMKFPRSGYFLWIGAFGPQVIKQLSEFDIFHAIDFSMFSPMIGIMSKRLFNTPAVLTCTYHPPSAMTHKKLKELYDKVVGKHILDEYDVLIVHSKYELDTLKSYYPYVDLKKIRRIPHGLAARSKSNVSFRAKYSLGDDFLVLCAGRIDSHKGIVHALKAVKLLVAHDTIKNLHMVLLGEEESWYKCPTLVKRLIKDLGNRIVFTGKVPPELLATAYAESDVALLASKYETFSYVVLEALSYGTPVISTKVGIAPELIQNGFNGFLYDYGDVHDLALKIKSAYEKRQDMKDLTCQTVSHLTFDKEIKQTVDVYKSLLKQKS